MCAAPPTSAPPTPSPSQPVSPGDVVARLPPAGELRVIVDGEFLAIESPTYLEYTWIWAEPAAPGEPKYTVVKVSFRDLGDERTEIVLTHEGFVDPDDRDDHTSGWTSILDHLASALGTTRPGA